MSKFRTGRRKDGRTYRYPVGPSRGRRIGKKVVGYKPKTPLQPPTLSRKMKESFVRGVIKSILSQTFFFKEINSTFTVADSIYTNWTLIKELYKNYEKEGFIGVVKSDVVQNAVSSIQTNIIWGVIKKYIPESYQTDSYNTILTITDKVTDEEIKYVEKFLK